MLKIQESTDDDLHLYYQYIRNLQLIYISFSLKHPSLSQINKLLVLIDDYYIKLSKEYLQSITTRLEFYVREAVFNRQKAFFKYFKDNYFFDIPEERQEEIQKIISMDLKHNVFTSDVIEHHSIYNNESIQPLLEQTISQSSRFMYYEQFFFWMRGYMEQYQKTMKVLIRGESSLSMEYKYYLALMAASTMKNEFFFRELEEEFLNVGGDESWLIAGRDVIPTKLKNISILNTLLAHQPWKIQADDILKLKIHWNLNELIEAAMIFIQFHKLSLIEENLRVRQSNTEKSLFNHDKHKHFQSSLYKEQQEEEGDDNDEVDNGIDKESQAELIRIVEEVQKEDEASSSIDEEPPMTYVPFNKITIKQESFHIDSNENNTSKQEAILLDQMFTKHTCLDNQKFSFKGPHKEIVCTYLEFNWLDHGIHTLQNLHPSGVGSLDDELQYILSLNSNSIGHVSNLISTTPIRRAINHYIESLFGFYHEDYNYSNITKLLDGTIKYTRYIKKITCYPKKLNDEDLKDMAKVFTQEEILHIILLAALVKSRIQLIYLAKAINDVMKSID